MLSATRFVARTARKTAVCPQAIAKFTVAAQSDSESASKAGKAAWLAAGAFAAVSMLAFSNNQAQCEATKKEVKRDGKDAVAAHDLHHDHHVYNTKELSRGIKVFTGTANPALAQEIVKHLDLQLGKITVGRFADGEVNVQVNEHIRGRDVYIVQPTLPPVNESLMELLLMISTMRRASARKITAIIPYYGYARQDRKMQSRVPISAADVARLLEAVGVDRVVAVDLHSGQIQGFFRPRVPVDNLEGFTVGVTYFGDMDLVNPVVVSPDAGGVYRAKQFRDLLARKHGTDSSLAMIIKQRAKANEIDRMDLVGNVEGCDCILVDDMVDTAGTLCKAVEALKEKGARRVFAFCSHGVLSGPAAERIKNSGLTELVILDTIPLSEELKNTGKITQLTVGPLLAQAISNIHNRKSISALFK